MRVIITRPDNEAAPWLKALRDAGYDSSNLPLIDITPARNPAALQSSWARLGEFDAVMFVSRNAVQHFYMQNVAQTPVFTAQAAIKTRAFVTGPGSYAALMRAGAQPTWVDAPDAQHDQFDSEALWNVVRHRVMPGYRVLIVRGNTVADNAAGPADDGSGRDWFAHQVHAAGGSVEFVVSYERACPRWDSATSAAARQAASDGTVWVFTSSEALRNLQQCCPGVDWTQAKAVVTHPRIGAAARLAGFGRLHESKPQLAALLASIESLQ